MIQIGDKVFANALVDLASRAYPWWAVRVGGKRWKRVHALRVQNGKVEARLRRKRSYVWTAIEGLSCIRGDDA